MYQKFNRLYRSTNLSRFVGIPLKCICLPTCAHTHTNPVQKCKSGQNASLINKNQILKKIEQIYYWKFKEILLQSLMSNSEINNSI